MSKLWKKNYLKNNCIEIWAIQEKRAFYSVFVLFLSFLHSLLIFWPIFTFYTAIESYGHVDYTCFIHFEKSQKMKALGHKNVILVKSWTSQPWTIPLDTFYLAKYPKKNFNFQVSYHFGKLLSSRFQNCCRLCNILEIGHFRGQ